MFGLFKKREPGPRRLKLHDVQARLHNINGKNFAASISQTRWSDGEGKLRIGVPRLRDGRNGAATASLHYEGEQVAEFALKRGDLDFRWQGQVTPEMPKFEIGRTVRIEAGSLIFEGVVEAD